MQKQSLTKGFAVMSAASIIVKIMSFLYIPFLMAIIGDEGTGVYGVIYQVYVFIYVIANSGIPVAISKSISELTAIGNEKDALRAFKIARSYLIILGLLLSLIMFITAKPVANMLNCEKASLGIAVLSPTLFITAVISSYRGYFQGRGNMSPTAISQVIEQFVNVFFTLLFAYLFRETVEGSCAGATVGTSVGALVAAMYLIYIFKRNREYRQYRDPNVKKLPYGELAKRIIKYSIPITICVAAQYAGNLIDLTNTMSRLNAAGYSEVEASKLYGLLFKYQQLINAPIAIASALAATILPIISAAVAIQDKKQLDEKTNYTFRLCFFISIPSAVGMSILSKQLYSILGYGDGYKLMMYGSALLILMSISQIQTSILQGAGKLYKATFYLLIGIVVKIMINYILIGIRAINIMGAIIGSIVGFIVPIVLNTIEIKKSMDVDINLLKLASKPLISSAIMGLAVWLVYKPLYFVLKFIGSIYIANAISTCIAVSVGVVVFAYIMIYVRGITKEDLNNMPAKLKLIIPKRILTMIR
ncbi:putative polysaccharide biosynthesis protein [Acetivibrio clariflavus]|mgnify:FL=1|uniref:putative polysaccharide biosynthesis protein n=1 Tax=Acetivibrio clariflavus TaxID=288965 RepID=UPI0004830A57|nr:polysaccharide biosynthesis protein [Acetivibrio clariflavus]